MILVTCVALVVIGLAWYEHLKAVRGRERPSAEERHRELGSELQGYRESRSLDQYRSSKDIHSEEFYVNLVKTIAHTEKIIREIDDQASIDYAAVLRTCNPTYHGDPLYHFYPIHGRFVIEILEDFNFDDILATALALRDVTPIGLNEPEKRGKLLAFEINISTIDGAPEVYSDSFVDNLDIPPIDTWFFVTSKYLYCWIPTMFIGKMQAAIDVEVLNSYTWLEEADPEFNQMIMEKLRNQFS